ncbi:HI0074 family nucleotidyltransferase substrate-binding subunit [Desulfoluna spongiiphila]|uniref:Nucleotidyltransferase substrate binding protein, HI0074 family n=1 Tax=Desulfoluna spongiiphila TaxID=419481 RepID=A0A1G5GSR2_9BACT|nr:HI0074 family nucleotidyltransferase substrate-binding subunit [Desulfoluna spongiiphila]SCY54583.1 nucleotidyltransferase substrate binding protein, HI0074 family [Desulfoluna spongiiphila]VVS92887.1 nucleotidyltransferase substrate binding protein hi0074 [Desulfoluna spongiiphila]
MPLELSRLKKATTSLELLLSRVQNSDLMGSLDEVTRYGLRAGVILNFEFTYELCWKSLKRRLEENIGSTYVDGVTRRELFRYGAENRLIDDVDLWMDFHRSRNMTSHTYDVSVADDVFESAALFSKEAVRFLAALEARND